MTLLPKLPCDHRTAASIHDAVRMLESAVADGAFTAWSIALQTNRALGHRGIVTLSSAYADEWSPNHPSPTAFGGAVGAICDHPVFDLASLTKPLLAGLTFAETPLDARRQAEILLAEGLPDEALADLLPAGHQLGSHLCLADLFAHRAGLPAWVWFGRGLYNEQSRSIGSLTPAAASRTGRCGPKMDAVRLQAFRRSLLGSFFSRRIESEPGATGGPNYPTLYSDCGYYVLAKFFESSFWKKETGWHSWSQTLGDLNQRLQTSFSHASLTPETAARAVPFYRYFVTESQDPSQLLDAAAWYGPCADTNANILAELQPQYPELSAHAGLFGNARDTLIGLERLLAVTESLVHHGVLPRSGSERFRFCLDTAAGTASVSGAPQQASPSTRGHLGYTGTSMWGDSSSGFAWVLLTNRTSGRRSSNASACPRLFRLDGPESSYFALREPGTSGDTEVSADDWEEERSRMSGIHTLLWDGSQVGPFRNINTLRQSIGQTLWSLAP